jgi:hypothetical protein
MRQVADYINEKKREAEALNLVVRIQDAIHSLARLLPPPNSISPLATRADLTTQRIAVCRVPCVACRASCVV